MTTTPYICISDFKIAAHGLGIEDLENTPLGQLLSEIGGGEHTALRQRLATRLAERYAHDRSLDAYIMSFLGRELTEHRMKLGSTDDTVRAAFDSSLGRRAGWVMRLLYDISPTVNTLVNRYGPVQIGNYSSFYIEHLIVADPDPAEVEEMMTVEAYNQVFRLPTSLSDLRPKSIVEFGYQLNDGRSLAKATIRSAARLADDIDEEEAVRMLRETGGNRWPIVTAIAQTLMSGETLREAFSKPLPFDYIVAAQE